MTTFLYAPLLQPLQIGKLTIPNRFCAGPLTLPSVHGPFGEFSQDGLAYYEARAKGGFGLIFTGAFHPDTLVDPVHPLGQQAAPEGPQGLPALRRGAVGAAGRLRDQDDPPDLHGLRPERPRLLLPLGNPLLPRPRPAWPPPSPRTRSGRRSTR